MNPNTPIQQISALAVSEGAGVTVHRTIGTPALQNLDPFMMLDHFSSDDPNQYIAGFPDHPHRGFSTFTYMIDGNMEHRDSMGNTGRLGPGSAQLMKAASGVIHSEMPKQENGLMRGFQLWINLPAANKMDTPDYQEFEPDAFPVVDTGEYRARLLIGELSGTQAPIVDAITQLTYFDVEVRANQHFDYTFLTGQNSFVFVFEGEGHLNDLPTTLNSLTALDTSVNHIDFVAGDSGARMIVASGRPINEPIVKYGPFVMNTEAEIRQAIRDYQAGNLVRDRAKMSNS